MTNTMRSTGSPTHDRVPGSAPSRSPLPWSLPMPTKTPRHAVGDLYLTLIREFPLRPIRSEADLDGAIAMIDALTDRGELRPDEQDYLDVLSKLVEEYEDE